MWAYNVITQRPEEGDLSLGDDWAQLAGLNGDESAAALDQVQAVTLAIESLVNAGALGPRGVTLNLTVSGHANPDHRPTLVGGGVGRPDYVTLSVAQVGYPEAGSGAPGSVVTEPIPAASPDASPDPDAKTDVEPDAAADAALGARLGAPSVVVVPPVGQDPEGWPALGQKAGERRVALGARRARVNLDAWRAATGGTERRVGAIDRRVAEAV